MGCLSNHEDDDVSDVSENEVAFFKLHLTRLLTVHDFSNVGQCSWSSITRDGMQVQGEEGKFLIMWSYLPFNARNVPRSVMHVSRLFLHSTCQRHVCLHSLGQEKKGELATMSLEFDYLHRKSRCETLIGGDDISNDVLALGMCFAMFVYIHAHFCFALIVRNLAVQSTGSHRGIGDVVARCPSFLFPPCHQGALETLLTGYFLQGLTLCLLLLQNRIPDRNDAAAVQQFFMEEIQIGEDLIHQGLFSPFVFGWEGTSFVGH